MQTKHMAAAIALAVGSSMALGLPAYAAADTEEGAMQQYEQQDQAAGKAGEAAGQAAAETGDPATEFDRDAQATEDYLREIDKSMQQARQAPDQDGFQQAISKASETLDEAMQTAEGEQLDMLQELQQALDRAGQAQDPQDAQQALMQAEQSLQAALELQTPGCATSPECE